MCFFGAKNALKMTDIVERLLLYTNVRSLVAFFFQVSAEEAATCKAESNMLNTH